jgi:hypothetical protein
MINNKLPPSITPTTVNRSLISGDQIVELFAAWLKRHGSNPEPLMLEQSSALICT